MRSAQAPGASPPPPAAGRRRPSAAVRIATAAVVFVAALEVGLRIYNPLPFRVRGDHIVLPVHQSYTITVHGAAKVDPVIHVTKNSLGFRGPEPPHDWSRRVTILTIGGSTTECVYLADGRTWTDQFARRVREVAPDVWINNAGFEGHSTFGHLVLLREYVLALRPTVAIFLIGVNDQKIAEARASEGEFNPTHLSRVHRVLTFAADHSEIAAVAENLVRMWQAYKGGLQSEEEPIDTFLRSALPEDYQRTVIDEHRTKWVTGFRERVREIVRITRERGIEPVLVTQPALFGDAMDPTTGIALGPLVTGYNTNSLLDWRILETYNDATRQVSAETGVRLVDLARELPKDSKFYYDWIHYTNAGAVVVGDIIFDRLSAWLQTLRP